MGASDPIEHVVVLMLENCSFDCVLGACQRFKEKIDGIPASGTARSNRYEGKTYRQAPGAIRVVAEDPMHETPHVLGQLKPNGNGLPSGFVEDCARTYHMLTADGRGEVMKYYDVDSLPCACAAFPRLRPLVLFGARSDLGEPTVRDERNVTWARRHARRDHEPQPTLV